MAQSKTDGPNLNFGSITEPKELSDALRDEFRKAISQENGAHLSAIFQHYFDKKFGDYLQDRFWHYPPRHLSYCLELADKASHPAAAIQHFKTLLKHCRDNIPRIELFKDCYESFQHNIQSCFVKLVGEHKTDGIRLDENTVIELFDLLLSVKEDNNPHVSVHMLYAAARNPPTKLLTHLLKYADPNDIQCAPPYGPIAAAFRSFNFEAIEILLNHDVEIECGVKYECDYFASETGSETKIDHVFMWLDEADKRARALSGEQQSEANRVIEKIKFILKSEYKDLANFKALVERVCKEPDSVGREILKGILQQGGLPKEHVECLLLAFIPKKVSPGNGTTPQPSNPQPRFKYDSVEGQPAPSASQDTPTSTLSS